MRIFNEGSLLIDRNATQNIRDRSLLAEGKCIHVCNVRVPRVPSMRLSMCNLGLYQHAAALAGATHFRISATAGRSTLGMSF